MDRADAGRQLARRMEHLRGADLVVLGLPRGGVPVAAPIAEALHAPLDVIVVRKLGVPYQPELGMGAIGEGGARVVSDEVMRAARVSADELAEVERLERAELARRARVFRDVRRPTALAGRVALIVDDGIATGSTAAAACQVARASGAARVVLAAPVAPPEAVTMLEEFADEVIVLLTPERFFAIGEFYADFDQTGDAEVCRLLQTGQPDADRPSEADGPGDPDGLDGRPGPRPVAPGRDSPDPRRTKAAGPAPVAEEVFIPAGGLLLPGVLAVPENVRALVVFAHGSGSSRLSPRNRLVAARLQEVGLGTLLFDLLTPREEADRSNVFDIPLLAGRLIAATRWARARPGLRRLPIGYFGASTGAAAALLASAELGHGVAAVVSRGGRPDLAGPRLADVSAPTLLIVGGRDDVVLQLNHEAAEQLTCPRRLSVVPGATHLFEEPGTLSAVAELARDWFTEHLSAVGHQV